MVKYNPILKVKNPLKEKEFYAYVTIVGYYRFLYKVSLMDSMIIGAKKIRVCSLAL